MDVEQMHPTRKRLPDDPPSTPWRHEPQERSAFTIADAVAYTSIGKTRLYEFMLAGKLPFKQLGKRRLLLRADLDRLISPTS
jgi:excisionase family DNA binding protein